MKARILEIAGGVSIAYVIAALLANAAHAEVLVDGKVHQTTADRIIKQQALICAYGDWTFQTLPDGRTVITRGKYCVGSNNGK